MATAEEDPAIGLITIPRAVLSAAAGMVNSVERAVIGDSRVRTARRNAWDAMCADRARAQARDEMRQLIAALASSRPGPALPTGSALPTGPARPVGAVGPESAVSAQLSVGSSPRSSASHADLVSTGVSTGPDSRA